MLIPAIKKFYRAITSPVILSREAWNGMCDVTEAQNAAIRANTLTVTPPLYLTEDAAGSLLRVQLSDEVYCIQVNAKVTTSGTTRRGFYQGKVLNDPPNGPADENLAVSDVGTVPTGSGSVIVANLSELRGGAPLKVDGSAVILARRSTNNASLGDSSFQNQPYYIGEAWIAPFAFVTVTQSGGSDGDGSHFPNWTYTYTINGWSPASPQAPTGKFDYKPGYGSYTPGTEGYITYNGDGTWTLRYTDAQLGVDSDCST